MDYPWYELMSGDELGQGHILESCPVVVPSENQQSEVDLQWEQRNVIALSQSCELVKGREKIDNVLLCPIWTQNEVKAEHLRTRKGMEDVRRGHMPVFHLLAACELPRHSRAIRIVDFGETFSLPVRFVRRQAGMAAARLRLLPPYHEHLGQAFARFFMRVGLPQDIPAFR